MGYAAKIISDSINRWGNRLTTFEVTVPRIILAEWNTHCMFARNSASSRAIPVETMIRRVLEDPYIPEEFGRNQKGMQAGDALDATTSAHCEKDWLLARDQAVEAAKTLLSRGVHKQLTNRLLEPFMWHTIINTATDYDNFFHLRNHPMAHPGIAKPARMMEELYASSTPVPMYAEDRYPFHLPYLGEEDKDLIRTDSDGDDQVNENLCRVSIGKCARVSYLTHDGKRDYQKDVELYDRLHTSGHMCFDADTEVLTADGWVYWPDVVEHAELLAVDIASGSATFERPEKLHKYAVDEELYSVVGHQLDMLVTANHRLVTSYRRSGGGWTDFSFEQAREVGDSPRRYLRTCSVDRAEDYPTVLGADPVLMALVGFFIGDGYALNGGQLRFHLKKKRKIAFLRSLPFPVRETSKGKYVVELPGIGRKFRELFYTAAGEKILPAWTLRMSLRQKLELFRGLRNSDGGAKRDTWVYSTTSAQVANMLQALLNTSGLVGTVSDSEYAPGKLIYRVNVSVRDTVRVEPRQAGRSTTYEVGMTKYTGNVYCATVSTGALLVRRNGKVVVSGNSPFEHVARPMTDFERTYFFRWWTTFEGGMVLPLQKLESDGPVVGELLALPGLVPLGGEWAKQRVTSARPVAYCGKFNGWIQYRKTIPNEHDFMGKHGD